MWSTYQIWQKSCKDVPRPHSHYQLFTDHYRIWWYAYQWQQSVQDMLWISYKTPLHRTRVVSGWEHSPSSRYRIKYVGFFACALCSQLTTMQDCEGFLSLGSQRGTTSPFPVLLFVNFVHASHTTASWQAVDFGHFYSPILDSCTDFPVNLKPHRDDICWHFSESASHPWNFF